MKKRRPRYIRFMRKPYLKRLFDMMKGYYGRSGMSPIGLKRMANQFNKSHPTLRDMKQFFKDLPIILLLAILGAATSATPRSDLARVNQYQGIYVFTDCMPERDYQVLGTVHPKGKGWAAMGMKDVQYENTRDGMVRVCKEEYPNAEGIILHLGRKDEGDAIKFK